MVPHTHEPRIAQGAARFERGLRIPVGEVTLVGDLALPAEPTGIVLFAHGSGSNRHSRRNRRVARTLLGAGLATLLLDLITAPEAAADAETFALTLNLPLLARRLAAATAWLSTDPTLAPLPVGYLGGSTGAAAALAAAAMMPSVVRAVVARGGRTDLAREHLSVVRAPTLLIVGSADATVLAINRADLSVLSCERDLVVVEGATHLFAEPGALDEVSRLAERWFRRHLPRANAAD